MKKSGLHIAFIIIILLMILPAVQLIFHPFREIPLNGAFNLAEKPVFSLDKWHSGEFQGQAEKYLKDHSGFRNFLVRLQNQLDYSLFSQPNAEGAVIGKNKQLFEYDYIRSWLAIDNPGESFIEKKLQRTKYVQEYLKREKGIDLIVVFEPGKASFYPEYLPSKYTSKKKGPSTYDLYVQKARDLHIDFIDLQQYFMKLKPVSKYPLFPRQGTHWSMYGMSYAADSLLKLIETRRNIHLTPYSIDRGKSMILSNKPFDTDDDVLKTMNLLFHPKSETLAYPVFSFDTVHPGDKPRVLVIADSYYWNIYNTGIPRHLFAREAFWYFNTLVYPDNYLQPLYTKDLDLQKEVEKQQVIFLMVTERFVHKFDWTFIDDLYALYSPCGLADPAYNKINDIMQVASWYEKIIKKADEKHITLEEALITEGKFLYLEDDTTGYMVNYGPGYFSNIISSDTGWMAHIREKAKKNNLTEEEMLNLDALYIFRQDYPGLYELNRGMTAMEERLQADPFAMDSLVREAKKYYIDPKLFIRLTAWQKYRDEEINKTRIAILSDPGWLAEVKLKAMNKGVALDEMIRLDAEYLWQERLKKF